MNVDAAAIVESSKAKEISIPKVSKLTFELYKPPVQRKPESDDCSFVLRELPSKQELLDNILDLHLGGTISSTDPADEVQVLYRSAAGDTAVIRYEKPKCLLPLHPYYNYLLISICTN